MGWVWPHAAFHLPHSPAVAEHLIAQHSAIKMLHSRVKLILEYVKASEAGRRGTSAIFTHSSSLLEKGLHPHQCSLIVPLGEVPFNHEILREAYALCHCLPVLSTDKFKTDFYDVSVNTLDGEVGLTAPHR